MRNRDDLSIKLKELLGSSNVYFQPPTNLKMTYPCIRYSVDGVGVFRADNTRLVNSKRYTVTHMFKTESNEMIEKMLLAFKYIAYDRRYISDGIYHDVYEIYW